MRRKKRVEAQQEADTFFFVSFLIVAKEIKYTIA